MNSHLPPYTFSTTECLQCSGGRLLQYKNTFCRTLDPKWEWAFDPELYFTVSINPNITLESALQQTG